MIRSLKKKDGFHPKLKEYAQVYFDECHHAASDSAIEVLQEINAKYVYGVTATPKRGDGKEKINEFLLGPIRYRFTAKDRAEEQNINVTTVRVQMKIALTKLRESLGTPYMIAILMFL